MTRTRRAEITAVFRDRIARALETGALAPGDRLPGTRWLAAEARANPRVVAAALRALATEGLVELRPRSGVYVAPTHTREHDLFARHSVWMTNVLVAGILRGIPGHSLHAVAQFATRKRVRAAVIATTTDQLAGIANELRNHYGVSSEQVPIELIRGPGTSVPHAIERAHLLVTTEAHGPLVRRIGERLGKTWIVGSVRPDLVGTEWLAALKGPVVVVAEDPRFLRYVREYLAAYPEAAHVQFIPVADRIALHRISPDSALYVTQAARGILGRTRLRGRLIPPTRIFATECVRAIVQVIVHANIHRRSTPAGTKGLK